MSGTFCSLWGNQWPGLLEAAEAKVRAWRGKGRMQEPSLTWRPAGVLSHAGSTTAVPTSLQLPLPWPCSREAWRPNPLSNRAAASLRAIQAPASLPGVTHLGAGRGKGGLGILLPLPLCAILVSKEWTVWAGQSGLCLNARSAAPQLRDLQAGALTFEPVSLSVCFLGNNNCTYLL